MTTSTEYTTLAEIPLQVMVNPLWRSLPHLPKGARALCQHDEWYMKKHPKARDWYWADELFSLVRLTHGRDLGDVEQYYTVLLDAEVLISLRTFAPSVPDPEPFLG